MKVVVSLKSESFKLDDSGLAVENFDPSRLHVDLCAAREDFAAFQVLVQADEDYTLLSSDATWFSQRMARKNIRVKFSFPLPFRMYQQEAFADMKGIRYNDLCTPADAKEYEAGKIGALFVHIPVGKNVKAGDYEGKIELYSGHLFSDEEKIAEATVSLRVCAFTLPKPQKQKFYLDLWQHNGNVARKADVPLWSDAHFEVLDSYLGALADLGQRALTVLVSEAPWSGQNCYETEDRRENLFEYSMIPITKKRDGSFIFDLSFMQRYIDLGKKHGIDKEISLYGIINIWAGALGKPAEDYPDGIRVRYFDEKSGCFRYMRRAEEIDTYLRALENYFITTGQIEKVRVAADEPADVPAFRKSIEHVHSVVPAFKFKAAINHEEFISEFGEEISDFVPYLQFVTSSLERMQNYRKTMPGKRFLWYVCCGPDHPNTFLSSPLTESYLIGVLTSYFRLDGFLRWNFTVWPDDPRKDIQCRFWPTGDVNFVYPGSNGKPLYTLRYFALMRAIHFYELLETYRRRAGVRKYNEVMSTLIRKKDENGPLQYDFDHYVLPSAEEFFSVYEKLLNELS